MIVAVFSDVHGNLPALNTFLAATRVIADQYLCLGDVVNYGPWNDECLEIVVALPGVRFIEGNHERLFLNADAIELQQPLVREFYEHSSRNFSRRDLIRDLPTECELGSFECRHTLGTARTFRDSDVELERSFMIGHSHQQFAIARNGYHLVNPGSVGQNRSNLAIAQYALFNSGTESIELCSIEYPYETLLGEMKARGYSERCLQYCRSKLPRADGPHA
ncbi:MAG: metallophosphoesterase family protein [Candidatus Acidiferrales bacterium]